MTRAPSVDPYRVDDRVALPAAALTTAAWTALVVLVPLAAISLAVWIAENRSGAPALDTVRFAADGWLLAHGVELQTGSGRVGLVPLLLTAWILRQLYRAGRSSALATGADSWLAVGRVTVAVAIAYGFLGMAAALVGATATVRADPGAAGLYTGGLAFVGAGWGAARAAGMSGLAVARLPDVVRRGLTAGAVAGAAVLAAGALAAGAQTLAMADAVRGVFGYLQPGLVGGLALVGLCMLYAPTAGVWAAGYLIGPGFSVGAGTTVDASSVASAQLPAFPLLAAVPDGPASPTASLALAAPLIAGVLAGVVTARPSGRTGSAVPARPAGRVWTTLRRWWSSEPTPPPLGLPRWRIALGGALLAGPTAGLIVGIASAASSGPLGSGRLVDVGPVAWQVGVVLALEVTVAALVGATVARTLASWSVWSATRRRRPVRVRERPADGPTARRPTADAAPGAGPDENADATG